MGKTRHDRTGGATMGIKPRQPGRAASSPQNVVPRLVPTIVLAGVCAFVLIDQNHKVGFEPDHHGWVSAHTLAIVKRATARNGFVGYTTASKNEATEREYDYFDRYPVFFSVAMNLAITTIPLSLSQEILVARQAMNVIFLATLVLSYLLLRTLTKNPLLSLSATLCTFSGYYVVRYRDMVHFEQPALLGVVLLLFAIARYRLDGKRRLLFVATAVAVSAGRGYVSYSVLAAWGLIEAALALKASRFDPRVATKRILQLDVVKAGLLAIALGALCLSYNAFREATARGIPIHEVGIVRSAQRRLLDNDKLNEKQRRALRWANFSEYQIKRLKASLTPYGVRWWKDVSAAIPSALFHSLVALCILFFIARAARSRRPIFLVMVFSGFLWVFPMRNLTLFHDYTTIHYLGLGLTFFTAVFSLLPRRLDAIPLALTLWLFVAAIASQNDVMDRLAKEVNVYSHDFEEIVVHLKPGENIYVNGDVREIVPGVPYALGFYLSDQWLTPRDQARYVVSRHRRFPGKLLTPRNRRVFLFEG